MLETCTILPSACEAGSLLPLSRDRLSGVPQHLFQAGSMPLAAGTELVAATGKALFRVFGHCWLGDGAGCPVLLALHASANPAPLTLGLRKSGYALAIITLSDKGSQGLREDTAGPLAASLLAESLPVCLIRNFILPDDKNRLRGLLAELALTQNYDLVCTCGGTGLSPRDITPQATESLIDYALPGFGEAMRAASLAKTPNAIISRAICGVAGACMIINLPGSAKAVAENLAPLLPALAHALAKLKGDTADCGGQS